MNTDHRGEADTYLHSDNLDFLEFEQDFSGLRNLRGGEEEKKKKSALDSILFPPCVILSYISFNQLVQHQVKVSRRATRSEVRFLHNLSYQTAQYQPNRGQLQFVMCPMQCVRVCGASRDLDGKITTCFFFFLSLSPNLTTSF